MTAFKSGQPQPAMMANQLEVGQGCCVPAIKHYTLAQIHVPLQFQASNEMVNFCCTIHTLS